MADGPDWDWERYRKLLHFVLRQTQLDPRLKRRYDSSDLVQETLTKAAAAWRRCRALGEGERVAWLKQILKNVAHDLRDREFADKRDPAREQSIQALAAESSVRLEALLPDDRQSTPGERLEREEELLRVAEALDELRAAQRDVIILRHTFALPVEAVAARLGLTEKAVSGLYQRGLHQLRQRLARLRE